MEHHRKLARHPHEKNRFFAFRPGPFQGPEPLSHPSVEPSNKKDPAARTRSLLIVRVVSGEASHIFGEDVDFGSREEPVGQITTMTAQ